MEDAGDGKLASLDDRLERVVSGLESNGDYGAALGELLRLALQQSTALQAHAALLSDLQERVQRLETQRSDNAG